MSPLPKDVTQLLLDWSNGNEEAVNELIPLVYNQLRGLANHYLRRERPNHTLQATALIHEAYLRLVDQTNVRWQNPARFWHRGQSERQILVNHALSHNSASEGAVRTNYPLMKRLVCRKTRRRLSSARRGPNTPGRTRLAAGPYRRASFLWRAHYPVSRSPWHLTSHSQTRVDHCQSLALSRNR